MVVCVCVGGVSAEETLQQHSGEECRWGEVGRKKEARPQLTEWMLRGSGGRGMERERGEGEGRHVTKCILITEQQMPRMELLCCLNSRTLHFSGLTSHRIYLPASCQFRVERVKKQEKRRERERGGKGREGGSHQFLPPSARLVGKLPFPSLFPRWPAQLAICITTHTSTHSEQRQSSLCLLAAAQ